MTVPDEAVESAAEWLPHSGDCEARPERECTCWQPRVNLMRAALEAAAPHIIRAAKAEAWDESAASIIDEHGNPIQPTNITNPYRSHA